MTLAVAGCGAQPQQPAGKDIVDCQPAGAPEFAPVCPVERTLTDAGLVLTIRHPDGSFRRLLVTSDGRGVAAADGAEPAVVSVAGENVIDVALAGNHYRLPATIKARP